VFAGGLIVGLCGGMWEVRGPAVAVGSLWLLFRWDCVMFDGSKMDPFRSEIRASLGRWLWILAYLPTKTNPNGI
jgi:hypothetical protein